MNKPVKTVLITTISLLTATLLTQSRAFAADITVICDTKNKCQMSPSAGAALFDKAQKDNTNMLPGDFIERTLLLVNKTDDTCAMYLKEIKNVRWGDKTFKDFPSKMWTAFETQYGIPYGAIQSNQPTPKATLEDLFREEGLPVTKIPAFSEEKVNWLVKFDPDTGNDYQKAEVWFDFDMYFECLPGPSTGEFTIQKTNLAWPNRLALGDEVLYKLTVRAQNEPVNNVRVIDAPPESLSYVKGSWTAVSNVRGDIKANGMVAEPSYTSPGIWGLGDLAEDETVTLTYRATIDNTATNGIYKDLAWAEGTVYDEESYNTDGEMRNETSIRILATSAESDFEIDGGVITSTFVGTQIQIDEPTEPKTENITIPVDEEEEVIETEVLGAATQALPATGAEIWITVGATILIMGGILTLLPEAALAKARKFLVITATTALFTIMGIHSAHAANALVLRISEPRTPDNQAFLIDYVALDTENNPIKIICEKKNPADTFFTSLSERLTKAGGDSGVCSIEEASLKEEGTYTVRVTAITREGTPEETVTSDEVAVEYKTTGPKRPSSIEKKKVNNCKYEIKIKTSSDKDIAYIEIYRSNKKDFTVGGNTRIRTVNIGPGETYTYTHSLYGSDCGNSYYAVRSFDAAGNPSNVRAETVEETVTIVREVTVEGDAPETVGILPVGDAGTLGTLVDTETEDGAATGEEPGTDVEGETADTEGEGSGGTPEDQEGDAEVLGAEDRRTTRWIVPGIIGFLIIFFSIKAIRGGNKNQ